MGYKQNPVEASGIKGRQKGFAYAGGCLDKPLFRAIRPQPFQGVKCLDLSSAGLKYPPHLRVWSCLVAQPAHVLINCWTMPGLGIGGQGLIIQRNAMVLPEVFKGLLKSSDAVRIHLVMDAVIPFYA